MKSGFRRTFGATSTVDKGSTAQVMVGVRSGHEGSSPDDDSAGHSRTMMKIGGWPELGWDGSNVDGQEYEIPRP
ncbi:hypothetical protein V6N11_075598 [Hibiscus sabdariffa]|uniref:Uncharacterized protein n=1 Tax=Hibiscus sabdariffa TaxID=183260 RepID=A0ABR2R702_9ROSI